ncbi:MAG: hypothetical protein ACI87E_004536 [Mariniblastus sp.]
MRLYNNSGPGQKQQRFNLTLTFPSLNNEFGFRQRFPTFFQGDVENVTFVVVVTLSISSVRQLIQR